MTEARLVAHALSGSPSAFEQIDPSADHLPGTAPLVMDEPLDVVMVRGINYFAEREVADSPNRRPAKWNRDYSSPEAYAKSVEPNRQRLREIIGAVDPLIETPRAMMFENRIARASAPLPESRAFIAPVTWDVMEGVTGEGYLLSATGGDGERPNVGPKACLVVIPDAGTTPPGETVPVDVTVDTAGLDEGKHAALLCVTTNDPTAPLVEVPVHLTVTEPPASPPSGW